MSCVPRMEAGPPPPYEDIIFRRIASSRLDLKQSVIDGVVGTLVPRGLVPAEDEPWLCLCLDEAVVNAMLHGNEGDPGFDIDVVVGLDSDRWYVQIADCGTGFDLAHLPKIDSDDALAAEHGRGVRLMADWLDDLTWFRGGAVTRMGRHRCDLAPATAAAPASESA